MTDERTNASAAQRRTRLQRVLCPRDVAVIGGDAAAEAARQLDAMGFTGAVWPVNPRRWTMAGRTCVPSVADLPRAPDAALVAAPAAACPDVFAALAARDAGGGVCFSAGFREGGDDVLQRELVDAAGDCALVGPNCHGVLNYLDGVALWPDDHGGSPCREGVALVSQSGNIALNATFEQRSVPLAYVIGTGNQAQLEVSDFVDALVDDPRVRAIGLFIEGLQDAGRFAAAARRAAEHDVPVVALKVGASEAARRASLSHTAALTGTDRVYDALFESLGVVRVDTPAEWLETLKLLSLHGPLSGRRVVSLSCSGGEAALMGDVLGRQGFTFPQPGAVRADRLAEVFGIPPAGVGNPLDYNTQVWGDAEACGEGFRAALDGPHDAGVLVLDFPPGDDGAAGNWRAALDGFVDAAAGGPGASVVLSTLPEALSPAAREAALNVGVVPLQGLAEGARALERAAECARLRGELRKDRAFWPGPPAVASPTRFTGAPLDEAASKARLAAYGLTIPAGSIATAAEAPEAAAAVGFPVAVKAASPELVHKTDAGAVALDLPDAPAVEAAVARMQRSLAAAGRSGTRLLVEAMVADAVAELIVGVSRDPLVGPVLVIGSGGVLAELVGDTRTLLLPTTTARIRAALAGLSVYPLLAGYRGGREGDIEAAVAACRAIAAFAVDHAGTLQELDVNPLLVRPAGRGAVAADACMVLAADDAGGSVSAGREEGATEAG